MVYIYCRSKITRNTPIHRRHCWESTASVAAFCFPKPMIASPKPFMDRANGQVPSFISNPDSISLPEAARVCLGAGNSAPCMAAVDRLLPDRGGPTLTLCGPSRLSALLIAIQSSARTIGTAYAAAIAATGETHSREAHRHWDRRSARTRTLDRPVRVGSRSRRSAYRSRTNHQELARAPDFRRTTSQGRDEPEPLYKPTPAYFAEMPRRFEFLGFQAPSHCPRCRSEK